MLIHHMMGAIVTVVLGLFGLFFPRQAAKFTSIEPSGAIGLSEVRATYGGFFLVLGGYCLLVHEPIAIQMLGCAWLGAAAARLFSVVVDRSRAPKNLGGVLFEAGIGALCVL